MCESRFLISVLFASYKLECNEYDILVTHTACNRYVRRNNYVTILSHTLKDTLRHEALIQKLSLYRMKAAKRASN